MNKAFISTLTAFSLILSLGYADTPTPLEGAPTEVIAEDTAATPAQEPSESTKEETTATAKEEEPAASTQTAAPREVDEGTPVSHSTGKEGQAARRTQWKNILLAVGAVIVAVTALILVANNNGKKSH